MLPYDKNPAGSTASRQQAPWTPLGPYEGNASTAGPVHRRGTLRQARAAVYIWCEHKEG